MSLYRAEPEPAKALGGWLKDNTNKTDSVYMLSSDGVLIKTQYFSEKLFCSKYFTSLFITGDVQRDIVYHDLLDKPPVFILKEPELPLTKQQYGSKIFNLIKANYSVFKVTGQYQIL